MGGVVIVEYHRLCAILSIGLVQYKRAARAVVIVAARAASAEGVLSTTAR